MPYDTTSTPAGLAFATLVLAAGLPVTTLLWRTVGVDPADARRRLGTVRAYSVWAAGVGLVLWSGGWTPTDLGAAPAWSAGAWAAGLAAARLGAVLDRRGRPAAGRPADEAAVTRRSALWTLAAAAAAWLGWLVAAGGPA